MTIMKSKLWIIALFSLAILGCKENNKTTPDESTAVTKDVQTYSQTTELPEGLHTPNVVETSIGTLNFMDGAPSKETAELVYENLDKMRGVDAFLKGMPAASVRQLILGPEALGTNQNNKVLIYDKLMDSKPYF
ncbi:MAG: hypothetical protein QNK20_01410, partial [Aureibaculum sp.]|nr:hypothetical protein [Aureibaculum sp.]